MMKSKLNVRPGQPHYRQSHNRRYNHKVSTTFEHLGRLFTQIGGASGKPMTRFIEETKANAKKAEGRK